MWNGICGWREGNECALRWIKGAWWSVEWPAGKNLRNEEAARVRGKTEGREGKRNA